MNLIEKVVFGHAFGRASARFLSGQHNKIQFFGYEVSNVVLVAQQFAQGGTNYGLNAETGAALSFLTGSTAIYGFHPQKNPTALFYGGLALTAGGLFLAAAGYGWTGFSVALASLETARGGLRLLQEEIKNRKENGQDVGAINKITDIFGRATVGLYAAPIEWLGNNFPKFGHFINDRPFVTGTLIKAPLRLEFIGKKLIAQDYIGAGVGMAWLFAGDIPLTLNDPKVKSYLERMGQKSPQPSVPA